MLDQGVGGEDEGFTIGPRVQTLSHGEKGEE